jgi:hypothetical protein
MAASKPRHRPGDFDWTDEAIADLRRRYALGENDSKIAREMHCSRSCVINKIRRLVLPDRPRAPIAVKDDAPKIRPNAKTTLPAIAAEGVPQAAPAPPDSGRRGGCNWPLWPDYGRPTHHYCGAPRVQGSYCAEHAALAISGPGGSIRWGNRL